MTDTNAFSFFSSSSSSKTEKAKKERNAAVMEYADEYARNIRIAVNGNELAIYLIAALIALKGKNSRFEVKDKRLLENAVYFARWGRSNDTNEPKGLTEMEMKETVNYAIKTVAQGVRWGNVQLSSVPVKESEQEQDDESKAESVKAAPDILASFTPEQMQAFALAMSNSLKATK